MSRVRHKHPILLTLALKTQDMCHDTIGNGMFEWEPTPLPPPLFFGPFLLIDVAKLVTL